MNCFQMVWEDYLCYFFSKARLVWRFRAVFVCFLVLFG